MRKWIVFAFVLMVAGCQGPSDGPGAGWIEIDGIRSEIVECTWREDIPLDGEDREPSHRIGATDAAGNIVFVRVPLEGGGQTVTLGGAECDGELSSAVGSWTVRATCPGSMERDLVAEIGSCDYRAAGE